MHILTSPTAALANVFSASVTSMKPSERQQNFGTTTILLSKRSRQLLMLLILQIIRKPSSAATGNCAYDNLIAAAKYMKEKHPEVLLRVNTNGLGELFNKKPIAEEMAKYIDAVSISLNAPTAERYQEVTQPCFENAFPDMLAFAEKSKKLFSSVQFSVVSIISQEEIDASQKIADEMGIPLKVRIYS